MAREAAAPYSTAGDRHHGPSHRLHGIRRALRGTVGELARTDWGSLDEPTIRDAIADLHRQAERIRAQITSASHELTARQARRLNPQDPGDRRARQQAERSTQNELADTLNITHSEAKDAVAAGGALAELSDACRQAFHDGTITRRHARKIAETIRGLAGSVESAALEAQLLERAREQNATEFGQTCRDFVARHDAEQAQRDLDQLRRRRYGSVVQDPDGMLHIRAGLVGAEAEVAMAAIEVFRDKDEPGDFREPSQRTADALFDALAHALRHAEATDHGNRPHVFVHVDADQLLGDVGPLHVPHAAR